MSWRALVITVSDRSSRGERPDTSGPLLASLLREIGVVVGDPVVVPDEVAWKGHNYQHLMEQPTLFYAIAITLALMDMGTGLNYWLAWGYVGFRVLHSLVQATVNIVKYRFALFLLSSICLVALTIHAAARIAHDCGLI